jgi:hypothetical protein
MDHADDDGNNDIFIYMGGDQRVPDDVTHVRIHKSVKIITREAFIGCRNLVSIEMHDGVEIIKELAFTYCTSLRKIKLPGVRVIGQKAFNSCAALEDVEFGDKLETIGDNSFVCTSLRSIKIPKIRVIEFAAFYSCKKLRDVELSKDLEIIGGHAFMSCPRLRRIAMPLKGNLLQNNIVFKECDELSTVNLAGGVNKTTSSLLLESWRNEMNDEIDRINRDLPNTPADNKTVLIGQWMDTVMQRIDHYKSEHYALLKNNMMQLELALWTANLPNIEADVAASRDEARVTCGANVIIPHVLSFLNDNDEFPTVDCNLIH